MKQSRTDDIIEARMRPGAITRDGLLGADRRKLRDILDADDAAVRRLGLSHAAIAARMPHPRPVGSARTGLRFGNCTGAFAVCDSDTASRCTDSGARPAARLSRKRPTMWAVFVFPPSHFLQEHFP